MNIKSIIKEEIDNHILTEVENELLELLGEQYNSQDDSSPTLPFYGDPMWNLNEEDYRGEHRAPDANDSPLYDVTLTGTYPDDIYTDNQALRYYGDGYPYDAKTLAIIRAYHNKPNRPVTIYRAVPKVITNQEKIADYEKQMAYIMKYGKIPNDVTNWGNRSEYYEFLSNEIEKLKNSPQEEKVGINNHDWVGITPEYVKAHGESQIGRGKYRVLSKVVPAKHVFTEGNSLHEWGYDNSMNEQTLNEEPMLNENTYKVYHGTNEKFSNFSFKNATQGIVWFTDSIDSIKKGEHGGQGSKYIMTRYITINKPAGWAEYEKYGLGQLQDMGYDGVILPQGDKTDYFVFSPKSISAKAPVGLNEQDQWYDIDPKLNTLKSYIHILNNSDKEYDLAKQYFLILHNFLIVERMFAEEVKAANKEINKNLNLEQLNSEEEVYQKFLELYDVNSKVRFGVETLDSIESIRQFLNKNPKIYQGLLKK